MRLARPAAAAPGAAAQPAASQPQSAPFLNLPPRPVALPARSMRGKFERMIRGIQDQVGGWVLAGGWRASVAPLAGQGAAAAMRARAAAARKQAAVCRRSRACLRPAAGACRAAQRLALSAPPPPKPPISLLTPASLPAPQQTTINPYNKP
jgi:hypothetical protein